MHIELREATKDIKGQIVLNHINMQLESGRIYGLQGKNGSGKTMLMRAVSGLIHLTEGSILIDGQTLGKEITFPKSMGILLEQPAFLPQYSGFKNLEILASIQEKITKKEIKEIVKAVGLDPDDKKSYKKYSLGMKQRLGVAAAIMEQPKLLLLDEPLNALDDSGIELVKNLILEEKSKGALVILACHDKEELEMLADEIYCMHNGEIVNHLVLNPR